MSSAASVLKSAAPFQSGIGGENADLREFMEGAPEEIAERQKDAALDLAATQKAVAILRKGGPNAYAKARRAMPQESRDWGDEHFEEEEHLATAERLAEFIRDSLEPI